MTIKSKLTKIAVATGVAGALIVPASAAQAGEKTERAIIGAILGGVAGAAIAKDDTAGVAIGAAAGAALGAATAKDKDRRYHRSYRSSRPYAYSDRYRTYQPRYAPAYNGYRNAGYYDQYGYYHRY
jgi:hypothetical protein